jgi:hypothetical protein
MFMIDLCMVLYPMFEFVDKGFTEGGTETEDKISDDQVTDTRAYKCN